MSGGSLGRAGRARGPKRLHFSELYAKLLEEVANEKKITEGRKARAEPPESEDEETDSDPSEGDLSVSPATTTGY